MKAQLLESAQPSQSQIPGCEPSNTLVSSAAVDVELEELKRSDLPTQPVTYIIKN